MAVMVAVVQPSLLGFGEPALDPHFAGVERTELAHGAWIERVPGWLAGEQTLFDELYPSAPWRAHQRPMYDRMVDVPRLTAHLDVDSAPPVLTAAVGVLRRRYDEPFDRIGLALYRDGRDSVAPHGDMVARDLDTTVMAIVSLGEPRRFTLGPVAGGPGLSFDLGRGDLLVMGGTIQRTWRHAVPKTNRPVGPRISVMIRPPWLG